MFNFNKLPKQLSHFTLSTENYGRRFLCILTSIWYYLYFLLIHSYKCVVISHCGFNLYFSNDQQCWTSFPVFIISLYSPSCLLLIFNWILIGFCHECYQVNTKVDMFNEWLFSGFSSYRSRPFVWVFKGDQI